MANVTQSTMTTSILKSFFPHTTTPFIANAPMFGSTNPEMASAVSKAGGFGFIGGGFDFSPTSSHLKDLEEKLDRTREILGLEVDEPLPIGIGFITFMPSKLHFEDVVIPLLLKHKVAAVWLAFPPDGADHAPIISAVRKAKEKNGWDVRVFVQAGDVKHLRQAIEQGADVVVAQGGDAGGHQFSQGASVVSLVPEVKDLIKSLGKEKDVAVIAAGGIVDGRGVAGALALGADGIVMGTRFLCSTEASVSKFVQETVLATTDGGSSTIKIHDDIQSTQFWPANTDGRAVIGKSWKDYKTGISETDNIALYKDAIAKGDNSRRTVWAGTGIGCVREIMPAGEIVKQTQKEALSIIARLSAVMGKL